MSNSNVINEFKQLEDDKLKDINNHLRMMNGIKRNPMVFSGYLRCLKIGDNKSSIVASGLPETLSGLVAQLLIYYGNELTSDLPKWLVAYNVAQEYDKIKGTHYAENQKNYILQRRRS